MASRIKIRVVTFKLIGPCGHELNDPLRPKDEGEDDSVFSEVEFPTFTAECEVCGKEYKMPARVKILRMLEGV
jgi:hypothetical protein